MVMDTTRDVIVIIPDSNDESRSRAVRASPLNSHHVDPSSKFTNSKPENSMSQASAPAMTVISAGTSQRLARTRFRMLVNLSKPNPQ